MKPPHKDSKKIITTDQYYAVEVHKDLPNFESQIRYYFDYEHEDINMLINLAEDDYPLLYYIDNDSTIVIYYQDYLKHITFGEEVSDLTTVLRRTAKHSERFYNFLKDHLPHSCESLYVDIDVHRSRILQYSSSSLFGFIYGIEYLLKNIKHAAMVKEITLVTNSNCRDQLTVNLERFYNLKKFSVTGGTEVTLLYFDVDGAHYYARNIPF